jgi:long-chain acyl-CoA synthetase
VKRFKKGVGILLKELDIPVVRVYIDGTFKAWPRTRKLPGLASVTIKFGKKMTLKDLELEKKGEDPYQDISDELWKCVSTMEKELV